MAWNRHAIAQTLARRQHRVDGVRRRKFDFHTGLQDVPALMPGEDDSSSLPPVEGQVKVNVMGEEVAIDADAYMASLLGGGSGGKRM